MGTMKLVCALVAVILIAVAFKLGEAHGPQSEMAPPTVYANGSQVSVYYPAEKKFYVYSELGGNCVYVYTLTTPGGPLNRENCR